MTWTLRELVDYSTDAVDAADARGTSLDVLVWIDDWEHRIPLELEGKALLIVVTPKGEVTDLIGPNDLASSLVDEGSLIDFKTGEITRRRVGP